jgi:ankyrin repeat protein
MTSRLLLALGLTSILIASIIPGCRQHPVDPSVLDRQLLDGAARGNAKTVLESLQQGAHIEARDINGATPLILAAESHQIPMLELLLQKGAAPEAKDQKGMTALVHAARSGFVDVVELLLSKTPDVNDKNQALFAVAETGIATVLISAEEYKTLRGGMPPGSGASERGVSPYLRMAKLLLSSGANIEARDENGDTPLIRAAGFGQTDIVRLLLEKGADVEATNKGGSSALAAGACECAVATMHDTLDIEKMLLEKRGAKGARDKQGGMALLAAAAWGRVQNVKLLLDNGAPVEATDDEGNTPLLISASGSAVSTIDTVRLLLENGANVEAKNSHGDTALILAASEEGMDSIDIVKLLLRKGANVRTENADGSTALSLARKNGHDEIAQLLQRSFRRK